MSSFHPPDILAVPRPYWYLRHIHTRPGLSSPPRFEDRDEFFKLLRSPGIDSKESITPAYVASGDRYDKPFPTRFLAPIDCSKIPTLFFSNELFPRQSFSQNRAKSI